MPIPGFPVYLFDVDGTLVDSWRDICGAIQTVLRADGRAGVPDEFLRRYIGRHLFDLFADLGYPEERMESLLVEYRRVYPLRGHASTSPFPYVKEALAALGGRKSTATTKGTPMTRTILDKFDLLQHFDHVQGTDGFPAKPAPDVILASLKVFGANPAECLLVGDAPADVEAGKRAGVKTCVVRYGYGVPSEFTGLEPDYWVDDLRELV